MDYTRKQHPRKGFPRFLSLSSRRGLGRGYTSRLKVRASPTGTAVTLKI